MKEISSQKFASVIARVLDDRKAKDISILNIANVSVLADYFVICSADATTQVKALTYAVRDAVKRTLREFLLEKKMTLKIGGIFLIMVM